MAGWEAAPLGWVVFVAGAVAEAGVMTGLERNSHIVLAPAYAPLFVNTNARPWPTNLIVFDNQRCGAAAQAGEALPSLGGSRSWVKRWYQGRGGQCRGWYLSLAAAGISLRPQGVGLGPPLVGGVQVRWLKQLS